MAIFGAGLANGDPIEVLGEVYLTDGFNYEYFDNCFFGCTASNTVDSTEQGNYTASGGLTLTYEPIPTPEPGSVLLFGTVLLGLYWAVRRKSISKT
jgi:PEP-CTERM motif